MPSRQRRAIFDNITRGPEDSAFVLVSSGLVVLTENIEFVAFEPLYESFRYLFRGPRGGWLVLHSLAAFPVYVNPGITKCALIAQLGLLRRV
jgi:hypothetical protein